MDGDKQNLSPVAPVLGDAETSYSSNSKSQSRAPRTFLDKAAEIRKALETDIAAADLKWSLFVSASQSYRHDTCLRPFPPWFVKNDEKDVNSLHEVMTLMPSMTTLLYLLSNPALYKQREPIIDLLHWVLIEKNEPKLKSVPKSEFQKILSSVNGNSNKAAEPNHMFEVITSKESRWEELVKSMKTHLAFHGSKLENYFSILNHGLLKSMSKLGLFGSGVYLSYELGVSLHYSPMSFGWGGSMLGSELSCVALCEVVHHPDVQFYEQKLTDEKGEGGISDDLPASYMIARNTEALRLKYLLVYAKNPHVIKKEEKVSLVGWVGKHKLLTLMIGYILLLGSVGMSNNSTVQRYYRMLLRRWGL